MEQKHKVQGNVIVKVKSDISDIDVFKCKKLNCNSVFFDYHDLQAHYVLSHGEIPKFLNKSNSTIYKKRFSKKSLSKHNLFTLKYQANKFATILKIYLNKNIKEKIIENDIKHEIKV